MPCSVAPSPDGRFILMKVTGEINRSLGIKYNSEAHALGASLGISRYLMDVTECLNTESVMGNYEFAHTDMRHAAGIDRAAVVAVVVNPADRSHDFIETVSKNAGLNVRFFTDRSAAEEYLRAE